MSEAPSEIPERRLSPEQEHLMEDLLPSVNAYIRMRTGDRLRARESISDLVQSTCREALQAKQAPPSADAHRFRAWLFGVAEHKICGRARYWSAKRRDADRDRGLSRVDEHEAVSVMRAYRVGASPSQLLTAREELERLEASLQRLPEDYREVILLRRVVGLSSRETAERIGRSEGATRQLFSQALARLSEMLLRTP